MKTGKKGAEVTRLFGPILGPFYMTRPFLVSVHEAQVVHTNQRLFLLYI